MKIVDIGDAKTNLSKLIQEACQGRGIVIARGAKPVVRLIPINQVKGPRQPGTLKGKLHVGPEFFEPLPTDELL